MRANTCAIISSQLTITASIFGATTSFLLDTGASVSCFPASKMPNLPLLPTNFTCSAANDLPIKCHGEITTSLIIPKLRREFRWTFLVADIIMPILGFDFLEFYKLVIDCGNKTLQDKTTSLLTPLQATSTKIPALQFQVQHSHPFIQTLLQDYPALSSPVNLHMSSRRTTGPFHYIETGDAPPVFAKPRRLSEHKLKAAKEEFKELLDAGIIRPSKSPWSSPLHLVPKKTPGSWRACGDFRALNSISKADRYGIPHIHSLGNLLHGSSIFSKVDLTRAYHQIKIRPEDIQKTAVTTPFGLYEYISMPFGLKNAGATFQRVMDSIFRDLPFVFTYIDDLLIFSPSEELHRDHLRQIFKVLHENSFRISLEKCEFFKTSIRFLGYNVSEKGLCIQEDKKSEFAAYPLPPDSQLFAAFLEWWDFTEDL